MMPLGLGEHGGLSVVREGPGFVAYLRYRTMRVGVIDSSGRASPELRHPGGH